MKHTKFLIVFAILSLCLSCFGGNSNYSYDEEEAESTTCSYCGGDGEIVGYCSTCNGRGYTTSSGVRQYTEQTMCSSCYGTGEVSCTKCDGYGYRTCSNCSGRGYRTCVACNGSGLFKFYSDIETCPRCDGSGAEECFLCNGSGRTNCCGDGRTTCPDCYGSGIGGNQTHTEPYTENHTCSSCGGYPQRVVECYHCNGTGTITED